MDIITKVMTNIFLRNLFNKISMNSYLTSSKTPTILFPTSFERSYSNLSLHPANVFILTQLNDI